ncbi:uncharacterized protein SPAPADRAFT_61239 [Spathaspora passalidarum NRRL Y-27907]|uniref:Uncharacterized protein n=1 Tax=Spathaspora passalidarum (strain NRRL Y-27907 / 11-Y1) TaxID=619300 RepID=G3API5_SPAPN|nr:uncharacterized protein SPAPADRAFT_61239 [Spathaspora passalidarum NRRL Y-27907]EGW32156.1 hypothetical protein SPAPADRAFT_61239 [Spathaspora passalidarum NRRL Y-27907]
MTETFKVCNRDLFDFCLGYFFGQLVTRLQQKNISPFDHLYSSRLRPLPQTHPTWRKIFPFVLNFYSVLLFASVLCVSIVKVTSSYLHRFGDCES